MTKRPFDSGRKDSLGRRVAVSGGRVQSSPASRKKLAEPARNSAEPLARWKQDAITAGLVHEIKDAIADATNLVSRTDEQRFLDDRILQRAAVSIAIQIGEAASKLDEGLRGLYPSVPWRAVMAMRHKLAHHYVDVDPQVLWDTLTVSLPELFDQLDLPAW